VDDTQQGGGRHVVCNRPKAEALVGAHEHGRGRPEPEVCVPEQAQAVGRCAEHVRNGQEDVVDFLLKGGAGRRHGEEV